MPLSIYAVRARNNFLAAAAGLSKDFDKRILFIYDPESMEQDLKKYSDQYDSIFYSMARKLTEPLDVKDSLFNRAINAHSQFVPDTYFSVRAIPHEPPNQIWFVKNKYQTAGQDIYVRNTESLLRRGELHSKYIIQKAVSDLLTYENKKFTIRAYIVFWNKKIYLYRGAFIIVHGKPYDQNSLDYDVQVKHDGYLEPNPPVVLRPFTDAPENESLFFSIKMAVHEMKEYAADIVKQSTLYSYCILGIDFLPLKSGSVMMVEINDMPNFEHTLEINQKINIPMFRDVIRMVTQSTGETDFELI